MHQRRDRYFFNPPYQMNADHVAAQKLSGHILFLYLLSGYFRNRLAVSEHVNKGLDGRVVFGSNVNPPALVFFTFKVIELMPMIVELV